MNLLNLLGKNDKMQGKPSIFCFFSICLIKSIVLEPLWIFRLGKTIQVISFLSGLFDMEKIKSVLIVLPVAVMVNWENEFNKW